MKKILVFHPVLATYRVDFFNDLSQKGGAIIYFLLRSFDVFNNFEDILKDLVFAPQYVYPQGMETVTVRYGKEYWDILDKEAPDVVVVFEFGAIPLNCIAHRIVRRRHYKIVTTCDDSADMILHATWRHRFWRRLCSFFLDDYITVSPKVQEYFKCKYNKGIYFPIIREENKAREEYQQVLPISNNLAIKYGLLNCRVYLYVGRLAPEKNVGHLIESFAHVHEHNERLVIIGSGTEEKKLQDMAYSLGIDVLFTGRLEGDDLKVWYNIADVFILPSTFEPFGAVTNEALLAGCFSLVSTIAGSNCLIQEGMNGYIFDPTLHDSLEKAIKKCRKNVPVHNEKIVLKKNLMKEKYSDLMDDLIKKLQSL